MDRHRISADGLSATILAAGAELCSLCDAAGAEFLWQADPAWPRHAPVLFPIVGRLAGDTLRHAGKSYRLTQHGFARDRVFEWAETGPASCRLALADDAATREAYPFAFRFSVDYAIADGALRVTFTVENPGGESLPASVGWHPAFVWPLRAGIAKTAHTLTFDHPEPAPIRRVAGGLLLPEPFASPIRGDTLALSPDLFAADAIVLDRPASHSVRYAAPGAPAIAVAWTGLPQLGIWTKGEADFLCIEPWHGFASPQGFDGDFIGKPGLLHIAPGGQAQASVTVRIVESSESD